MVSRLALVTVFGALSIGSAAFVVGCSSDDGDTQGSEDDIKKKKLGDEGALCDAASQCKAGLLCKRDSSGPPPGAVGMPLPPGSASSSGGPPPGAMGLPILPSGICKSSSAPPPGAVGLPLPPK